MKRNCGEEDRRFPESLVRHVRDRIVPRYASFDPAHREDHALSVMEGVLTLHDGAPSGLRRVLRPEILYVAAAYHDLGLAEGRELHHLASGRIVREDPELRRWFTQDEIETIAQAAEDHRASSGHEPRSWYGRIVAEADRTIDAEVLIRRTLQYGLTHYPELSSGEHLQRASQHLHEKYGRGGYLSLWVPWSDNALRLESFRQLIDDQDRLDQALRQSWALLQHP